MQRGQSALRPRDDLVVVLWPHQQVAGFIEPDSFSTTTEAPLPHIWRGVTGVALSWTPSVAVLGAVRFRFIKRFQGVEHRREYADCPTGPVQANTPEAFELEGRADKYPDVGRHDRFQPPCALAILATVRVRHDAIAVEDVGRTVKEQELPGISRCGDYLASRRVAMLKNDCFRHISLLGNTNLPFGFDLRCSTAPSIWTPDPVAAANTK